MSDISALALPALSRNEMDRQNRIARWRAPLRLPGSEAFSLQRLEQPRESEQRAADRLIIKLTLGPDPLTAGLPRALVLDLLRSLQSGLGLDPMPPPDLAALLLEAALLPLVEVLERGVGLAVGVHAVAALPPHPEPRPVATGASMRIALLLRGPGISQTLSVEATAQTMDRLLRNWSGGRRKLDLLPIPLALQAGSTILSARLVRSLRVGDAVLLQDTATVLSQDGSPSLLRLVVADTFLGTVQCAQAGWCLETKLRQAWRAGQTLSDDATVGPDDAEPTIDLDELPVRLVFEAGRLELPLGEVRRLGAGSILDIGTRPGRVRILVNGRHIGDGELVSIEQRAGVRIIALTADADTDPDQDSGGGADA